MGRARKRAAQAARWAARASYRTSAHDAPDDAPRAELNAIWQAAAADVDTCRARAHAENQKASAPCDACGRLMPAAERCADCRRNGLWYCSGCHARFEGAFD